MRSSRRLNHATWPTTIPTWDCNNEALLAKSLTSNIQRNKAACSNCQSGSKTGKLTSRYWFLQAKAAWIHVPRTSNNCQVAQRFSKLLFLAAFGWWLLPELCSAHGPSRPWQVEKLLAHIWHKEKNSQLTSGQFRVLVDIAELKKVVGSWENKASRERRQGQQ